MANAAAVPLGVSQTCFTPAQENAALARITPMPQLTDQQLLSTIPMDIFMEVLAYLDCKKDAVPHQSILNHPQLIEAAGRFLRNPAGLPSHIRSFITRVTNGDFKKHIMSLKALAEHNIVNKGEPVCFFVHRTMGGLNEQLSKGYTVYKGEPYPVPLPFLKWLKKDCGPSLSMLRDRYPGAPEMEEVFSYDSTFDPGARLKVGDRGVRFDTSKQNIPEQLINAFGYGQAIESIVFQNVGDDHVRITITRKINPTIPVGPSNPVVIVLNRKTKSYGNAIPNELDLASGNPYKNTTIHTGTDAVTADNLVIVKELGDGSQGMMASLNAGTQNIEYAVGTADDIVTLRSRLMHVGVLLLLSAEKEYANIGRVTYYSPIVDIAILLKNEMNYAREAALQHNKAYADRLKLINGTQIRIGRKILTGKCYVDLANNELKEVKNTAFFDFINEVLKSLKAVNEYIEKLDIEAAYQNRETGGVTQFKELCLMGKANHIISDIQHKGDTIGSTTIIVIGKFGSVKRLFSPLFSVTDTPYEAMDVIHQKNIQTNRFISSREQIHQMLNQSPSTAPKKQISVGGGYIGGGEPMCAPELNNNCIFFDARLNPTKRFYELIKQIIHAVLQQEEIVSMYNLDIPEHIKEINYINTYNNVKRLKGFYYLTSSLDSIAYDIYQYLLPYFSWLGYTCLDRETLEELITNLYDLGHLDSTHQNFMVAITMDEFRTLFYSLRLPAIEKADEEKEAAEQVVARMELLAELNFSTDEMPPLENNTNIPPIKIRLPKSFTNKNVKKFNPRLELLLRYKNKRHYKRTYKQTYDYILNQLIPSLSSQRAKTDAMNFISKLSYDKGSNKDVSSGQLHRTQSFVSTTGGRRTVKKRRRNKTLKKRKYNRKTKRHA